MGSTSTMWSTDRKAQLLDLVPPAMVIAVVAFWWLAPKALVDNAWTITVVTVVTAGLILAMEWVHERHVTWRLNWKEFLTDVFYMVLGFTAIEWATNNFAENPLKAVKAALHIHTPWTEHMPFLAQVALVLFLIEFGQYWMHRLMHNVTPFWLTHAPHHHITQLNALKGYVGNPIELFLISLSVVTLFDFELAPLFCAFNVLGVVSGFAHANVRSNPPIWYSYFFTTIRHHSLHHSVPWEDTRCNYANSLILIDRVFGTYREGEGIIVGQDQRKRLTIWEQFAFPFVPVVRYFRKRDEVSAA